MGNKTPSESDAPASADSRNTPYAVPEITGEKAVQTGRGWILAVACIQCASAIFMYFLTASQLGDLMDDPSVRASVLLGCGVMFVLGLVFFGFWIWAKKSPFPASLTTLIVYFSFIALDAVIDPATIARGIIMKIIIIIALYKAVKISYGVKRMKEPGL